MPLLTKIGHHPFRTLMQISYIQTNMIISRVSSGFHRLGGRGVSLSNFTITLLITRTTLLLSLMCGQGLLLLELNSFSWYVE